jgi:hypothetical protein
MMDPRLETFLGLGPCKMTHWESWSCPDAETYLTGIDYYAHPRLCRQRMAELYPMLRLTVPPTDDPIPSPTFETEGRSSDPKTHTVRWGDSRTATFQHGEAYFQSPEEVFAFSPLEHADMRGWEHVVMNWDFTSVETILAALRKDYPAEWGETSPEDEASEVGFYNTTFMWPLLTFGWELFLQCCLDPRFERIMDEFAEINRRVMQAFCHLPVNVVHCHDDIVSTRGPVCSPRWMHKYVFPRYEEYWAMLKTAGKTVVFQADGCMDAYAADVMACGAAGMITEPYTDFKRLARTYSNIYLAGEGDNRVLMRNDPVEIRCMVETMVETGRMSGGYMLGIGNHIPWNVPPKAIKVYLDLSDELGYR